MSAEWFRAVAAGIEAAVRGNLADLDEDAREAVGRWVWSVTIISERGAACAVRAVLRPVAMTYLRPGESKPRA